MNDKEIKMDFIPVAIPFLEDVVASAESESKFLGLLKLARQEKIKILQISYDFSNAYMIVVYTKLQ